MNTKVSPFGFVAIRSWGKTWHKDLIAGSSVFLIALPLSVGIAIASGAPPAAGIFSAMIGGIVGAFLGGSYLTINGPAAGLIVIVLNAIESLGHGDTLLGFKRVLAATLFAGLFQIVLGFSRLGIWALAVPGSVIHGMLTAIGVIIMAKQLHVAVGVIPSAKDPLGLLMELPRSILKINPEVALIAVIGILIIVSYKLFKGEWTKFLPAPLLVVTTGVLLAKLFDFEHAHLVMSHWLTLEAGPRLLLSIPTNLRQAMALPDFSALNTVSFWVHTLTIALVASIESLLSASAIDRMDPLKRHSHMDRELVSKGICNAICGCVGGLPIIAEMVRSSANIRSGAQSQGSNFFHAVFLVVFLLACPNILKEIPLAALAAILISVGYSLAHPNQFLKTAKVGKEHFLAFLVTLTVTLSTDLLIGVAAGIMVELLFNFIRGASLASLFRPVVIEEENSTHLYLKVESPLTFTNYVILKGVLDSKKEKGTFIVDLSKSLVIDHTSMEYLTHFEDERTHAGKKVKLTFSKEHHRLSSHPLGAVKLQEERTDLLNNTNF